MLVEIPAEARGEERPGPERPARRPRIDDGAALPDFAEVARRVARMLRDVAALRFAMQSLMSDSDRLLGVDLIRKRYRISNSRARQLLGLPARPHLKRMGR